MLERDIEAYLVRRVTRYGGEVRKVKWIGHRGAPDRLVMLPHVSPNWLIELKQKGKPLKKHQAREHERLAPYFKVFVVDTIEQIDALLPEIKLS